MTQKKVCLLVDDDIDDQEIFRFVVEESLNDVECTFASNGKTALRMLEQQEVAPDIIFLDLNMPLMKGLECLEQLRKIDHLAGLPVVIYSTTITEHDRDRGRALGVKNFLVKPSRTSELQAALSGILAGLD